MPDEAEAPRGTRRRPGCLGLLAGATLVSVLGLGLALVGLRLWATEARLARAVSEAASDALPGRLEVDALAWSLPLEVELRGARLYAPDGTPAASLGRVRLRVELGALLSGRARVSGVEIRGVRLPLVRSSSAAPWPIEAALIAPGPPAEPEPASGPLELPIRVELGPSRVEDVAVRLSQPGVGAELGALRLELDGLHAEGRDAVLSGLRLSLEVRSSTPTPAARLSLHLAPTGARARLDGSAIELELGKLEVELADGTAPPASAGRRLLAVGVAGRVRLDAPRIETRLDLEAGLDPSGGWWQAALPTELRRALAPDGRLGLKARLEGRWPGEGDLDVTLEGPLSVAGLTIPGGRLHGAWSGDEARIDPFELGLLPRRPGREPGGRLSLRGTVGLDPPAARHDLQLVLERLPLAAGAAPFVAGVLPRTLTATLTARAASATATGLASRLDLSARTEGRPPTWPSAAPDQLRLRARLDVDPREARIEALRLDAGPARAELSGRAAFDPTGPLELRLTVDAAPLGPSLAALGLPVDARALHLSARAQGTARHPRLAAELAVQGLGQPGALRGPLDARLRATPERLDVERLSWRPGRGALTVTGAVTGLAAGQPTLDLELELDALPLAAAGPLGGRLDGALRLEGPATRPRGRGRLGVGALSVAGEPLGRLRLELRSDGEILRIAPLSLTATAGLALEGEMALGLADLALDGRLRVDTLELVRLSRLSGGAVALAGVLRAELRLGGRATAPLFDLRLDVPELVLGDTAAGRLGVRARGDLNALEAELSLAGPAGTLSLTASVAPRRERLDARLEGSALDLARLARAAPSAPAVRGRVDLSLSATGALRRPALDGRVDARGLGLDALELPHGVSLRLATEGGDWRVRGEALGAVRLDARVRPPVGRDGPGVDAAIAVDRLDLTPLVPALADGGARAELSATSRVTLQDAALGVDGALTGLEYVREGRAVTLREPAPFTVRGGELALGPVRLALPGGGVEARARVGETLDVQARGRIELDLLDPFVGALSGMSGALDFEASVGGRPEHPEPRLDARIARTLAFRPRGMLREIEIDTGTIGFASDTLRITGLSGRYGGGTIELAGSLGLVDGRPARWDFEVRGRGIGVRAGDLALELSPRLLARGSGPLPTISGRVDIVRGRLRKKLSLSDFTFVPEPDLSEPRGPSPLDDLALDVRAVGDAALDVHVDAGVMGVDLLLGTDVHVTGTAARPVLAGRVGTSQGSISFPQAELRVVSSAVDFVPNLDSGTDIVVELIAEGEVVARKSGGSPPATYLVTMGLSGPMDRVVLELRADPPLGRLEVLSLLVTGYDQLQQVVEGGSSSDQSTVDTALAFAAAQLAGPLVSFVEQQIADQLGVDLDLGAEITTERVRVSVGKDLGRRVRIEGAYDRALASDAETTTTVARILLSDAWFLEGSTQTAAGQDAEDPGTRGRLELKVRLIGD